MPAALKGSARNSRPPSKKFPLTAQALQVSLTASTAYARFPVGPSTNPWWKRTLRSGVKARRSNERNVATNQTERRCHRKGIGTNTSFDAGPGHGRGDRETLAGAWRVRANRRCASSISQIVEKDTTSPLGLCRENILVGKARGDRRDESPGDAMRLVV